MTPRSSRIEPLEARIAPALVLQNPLLDLIGGGGKSSASIDLSKMFDTDPAVSSRTHVQFVTNFDADTVTPGLQPGIIELELLDDLAPLSVQNFLNYVNANAKGDYDNTYFHRAGQGFIIQGGGFDAAKFGRHIPITTPVHNEPDAVNRPNVRGAVAMAKVGGDPNSATSEWFINLGDNSGLDTQNGGFTVFANVVSGLDLADRISQLPYINAGSDGTGTPVQNYNSDPDNNPKTSSPIPTADQLVRITEAIVVPGASAGITYTASVVAPGTSIPSTLLKTSVKGSTLGLTFSGQAGVAEVIVTGRNALNETAEDRFTVTLAPNLVATVTQDTLPTLIVPGDKGTMKITVANGGSANLTTNVKVESYLSLVGAPGDADGTLVDAGDILIGTVASRALSLAPGKAAGISVPVELPSRIIGTDGQIYRIVTQVTPLSTVNQLNDFTDDDVARLSAEHAVFNQFGTLSFSGFTRSGAVMKLLQDDGNAATTDPLVSFSIKGGGRGTVSSPTAGELDLAVAGTTAASKLGVTVDRGQPHAELNDLAIDSVLGTADLAAVDLNGFAAFSGGVKTLRLGDLTGPGSLTIGAFLPANTTKATISLGRVSDYFFESAMPVASLTAIEWLDTGGAHETMTFYSLGKLNITGVAGAVRGDLGAGINVLGSGKVASINVAGFLHDAGIATFGDIGTLSLGGVEGGGIVVGVDLSAGPGEPAGDGTIGSFIIKGISGYTGNLFIDTRVTAGVFDSIVVQKVESTAAEDFGFIADVIKRYNRVGGPKLANLDDPTVFTPSGEADRLGSFLTKII